MLFRIYIFPFVPYLTLIEWTSFTLVVSIVLLHTLYSYQQNQFVLRSMQVCYSLLMETSLPIATDSFSYSWLSNCKPPVDCLEEPLRASFHSSYGVMNSDSLMAEPQNFNFDISINQSLAILGRADELFSDGFIRPVFVDSSKGESCNTPDSTQTMPSPSLCSRIVSPRTVESHHGFLTKWRKSTRKTLGNLFGYLKQFRQRVGCSRKSTRVDDFDKAEWQVESWSMSQQASPKPITDHSTGNLGHHENSIYEAVLHCKRSIGK